MRTLLVKRWDIEGEAPPAGRFGEVALGRGRLPAGILAPVGTFCVDTTDRVFALTYDDGPDPKSTPGVLEVLAQQHAKATFFVLSEQARRSPRLVERIVADGHELALHGRDHRSLLTLSTRAAIAAIRDARAVVEDIAGRPVHLFRPPYGEHTLAQAVAIRRIGLSVVIWSGAAQDWVDDAEDAVVARAVTAVFPGAILLLHDTRADPDTLAPGESLPTFDRAQVLERILGATRQAGFAEFVAGELMARYPTVRSLARERMHKK
ncbi:MAG TPA: polysaccharide deacetylase family protein [Actinomycetota bacterium]|nr:polysaccharide deacetylase family protein [Actinomycetota bacterium]